MTFFKPSVILYFFLYLLYVILKTFSYLIYSNVLSVPNRTFLYQDEFSNTIIFKSPLT